jgi:NADH:ubiquinone oxidoreductase subunit E
MKRVKVEICCGTACYLLGSAKLVTIEESLPENLRNLVDVEARTCLDLCERENLGGAPYVRFNNTEVMAQATPERVMKRILELVEGVA